MCPARVLCTLNFGTTREQQPPSPHARLTPTVSHTARTGAGVWCISQLAFYTTQHCAGMAERTSLPPPPPRGAARGALHATPFAARMLTFLLTALLHTATAQSVVPPPTDVVLRSTGEYTWIQGRLNVSWTPPA
ncbi:hypothetical protein EON66_11910, partial [archaeon]